MELWEDERGKKYLLKGGPEHTLRADYVGARLLGKVGVTCPAAQIVRSDGILKLRLDYLEEWEDGPIVLPERFHDNKEIQDGFFVDLLLRQYDRTSWNMMFQGDRVAFIDHGASLHSRARGGYKGFLPDVTVQDIAFVLEHPERSGHAVNEAYGRLVGVENGKLVIKDRPRVERLSSTLGNGEGIVNSAIDEAGFSDGRRSVEFLKKQLERLENEATLSAPGSREESMCLGAVDTLTRMIATGGEATYLKKTIMSRASGIVDMFYEALRT